jgi:hypothetical protein
MSSRLYFFSGGFRKGSIFLPFTTSRGFWSPSAFLDSWPLLHPHSQQCETYPLALSLSGSLTWEKSLICKEHCDSMGTSGHPRIIFPSQESQSHLPRPLGHMG